MRTILPLAALALTCSLTACGPHSRWTTSQHDAILRLEWQPGTAPPADPTDKYADDPKAAAFGQKLFFEKRLSSTGQVACATCHDPAHYFTDAKPVAQGLVSGTRNTPTVVGASFSTWDFWDGRKDSLWSQAVGPIENTKEMNFTRVEAVRVVLNNYQAEYEAIFGPLPAQVNQPDFPQRARPDPAGTTSSEGMAWDMIDPATQQAITIAYANLGKSIEAYERLLLPQRSRFDDYAAALRKGEERTDLLTEQELQGLGLFVGQANCVSCHDGPRFTDNGFHNLGLPPRPDEDPNSPDQGRRLGAHEVLTDPFNCASPLSDDTSHCDELKYLDPNFPDFDGAFKTPSLRNVALTAPYMHGGQMATLQDILTFYSTLPGTPLLGHRELTLKPLQLTADQQAAIIAFLGTLTGGPLPAELQAAPQ